MAAPKAFGFDKRSDADCHLLTRLASAEFVLNDLWYNPWTSAHICLPLHVSIHFFFSHTHILHAWWVAPVAWASGPPVPSQDRSGYIEAAELRQALPLMGEEARGVSGGDAPHQVAMSQNKTTRIWTAGFSLCFHLPGFYFGYLFLTHTQVARWRFFLCVFVGRPDIQFLSLLFLVEFKPTS